MGVNRYVVTCPYCLTRICGAAKSGVYDTVASAAKSLNAHLRFSCDCAPALAQHQRERVASYHVQTVEDYEQQREQQQLDAESEAYVADGERLAAERYRNSDE